MLLKTRKREWFFWYHTVSPSVKKTETLKNIICCLRQLCTIKIYFLPPGELKGDKKPKMKKQNHCQETAAGWWLSLLYFAFFFQP